MKWMLITGLKQIITASPNDIAFGRPFQLHVVVSWSQPFFIVTLVLLVERVASIVAISRVTRAHRTQTQQLIAPVTHVWTCPEAKCIC